MNGPEAVSTPHGATPEPHRRGLRRLTIVVFAGFLAVGVVLDIGVGQIVRDQEHRLLTERTGEVGELLSTAVAGTVQATLQGLASASQQPPSAFTRLSTAELAASRGSIVSIAVLARSGSDWVVRQSAGKQLAVGQPLTGAQLAVANGTGAVLHPGIIPAANGKTRLAVALGAPATAAGTLVYEEFAIDPSRSPAVTQTEPFHELNVALYAGNQPAASNLVIATTSSTPLKGHTASYPVPVGDSKWLVIASARHPLSGTLATSTPAILFLATVLIGLAMAVVVETLGRRRDYALSLVGQRTRDLQESLDRLGEAQQALVESERLAALGQMAATVGHELRNPLAVLTNSLFLIRSAVSGQADDRLRRQLDTADREVAAATLIISDLLEFSRPRVANPTSVDLSELLAEAVSVAPPPTGITVEQESMAGLHLTADRDQLRQVILNLLTNAYDAMPSGGQVRLGSRMIHGDVEITVTDTGVGMSAETQEQVFNPFFSLKIKGTGLGLAVSKRIVEGHSGSLSMVSEEGSGCTAVVRLPHASVATGAAR
jgi:signal transduction histidine kinase